MNDLKKMLRLVEGLIDVAKTQVALLKDVQESSEDSRVLEDRMSRGLGRMARDLQRGFGRMEATMQSSQHALEASLTQLGDRIEKALTPPAPPPAPPTGVADPKNWIDYGAKIFKHFKGSDEKKADEKSDTAAESKAGAWGAKALSAGDARRPSGVDAGAKSEWDSKAAPANTLKPGAAGWGATGRESRRPNTPLSPGMPAGNRPDDPSPGRSGWGAADKEAAKAAADARRLGSGSAELKADPKEKKAEAGPGILGLIKSNIYGYVASHALDWAKELVDDPDAFIAKMEEMIPKLIEGVQTALTKIGVALYKLAIWVFKRILPLLGEGLLWVWNEGIPKLWALFLEGLAWLGNEGLPALWDWILEGLSGLWDWFCEQWHHLGLDWLFEGIGKAFDDLGNFISEEISAFGTWITSGFNSVIEGLKNWVSETLKSLNPLNWFKSSIGSILTSAVEPAKLKMYRDQAAAEGITWEQKQLDSFRYIVSKVADQNTADNILSSEAALTAFGLRAVVPDRSGSSATQNLINTFQTKFEINVPPGNTQEQTEHITRAIDEQFKRQMGGMLKGVADELINPYTPRQ